MRKVLPVLFNTDMVLAILDGRKTVTRRVVKKSQCTILVKREPSELKEWRKLYPPFDGMTDAEIIASAYKPQYEPGDTLYVRETWSFMNCIECNGDYARGEQPCYDFQAVEYDDGDSISDGCFLYRADCKHPERINWHPSIHMPKEAARIWLKVTDVRVERLQDMTGQDILREGVNCHVHPEADYFDGNQKMMFAELWDSTVNKPDLDRYGWDANPWVWVIEFERCEKPEKL